MPRGPHNLRTHRMTGGQDLQEAPPSSWPWLPDLGRGARGRNGEDCCLPPLRFCFPTCRQAGVNARPGKSYVGYLPNLPGSAWGRVAPKCVCSEWALIPPEGRAGVRGQPGRQASSHLAQVQPWGWGEANRGPQGSVHRLQLIGLTILRPLAPSQCHPSTTHHPRPCFTSPQTQGCS